MFSSEEIVFARRVVLKKWTDEARVRECMDLKKAQVADPNPKRLWDLLVERGYLTPDQARAVRETTRSVK
ncbi:MAG: hypothetical protein HYZ53_28765 [Planctomycetes bacterium]|nr:hypothetical protein [Planctomycetota bacterium]